MHLTSLNYLLYMLTTLLLTSMMAVHHFDEATIISPAAWLHLSSAQTLPKTSRLSKALS